MIGRLFRLKNENNFIFIRFLRTLTIVEGTASRQSHYKIKLLYRFALDITYLCAKTVRLDGTCQANTLMEIIILLWA